MPRHCEEQSDEAIQFCVALDRFASLAMTGFSIRRFMMPLTSREAFIHAERCKALEFNFGLW